MEASIKEQLDLILKDAEQELSAVESQHDIEEVRIKTSGRKGNITTLSKELGKLSKEERPEAGKALNIAKNKIAELLDAAKKSLESGILQEASEIDVTLPGRKWPIGKKHPITQTIDDCIDICRRLGFIVAEGPDIETVYHCFDALNTPNDHPSKDESDTFYFDDGRLL